MRKQSRFVRLVAVVLAALLILGAVVSVVLSGVYARAEGARDRYVIEAEFLEDEQALRVSQRLTYWNRSGASLDRVEFSLYGNVFRRESALMYENAALPAAFPYGYAPGGFEFSSVTVNGETADWGLVGENELFLRVGCDLPAGASCEFGFAYTLLLTKNAAFLGAGDTDWRLTGFFPQALRFEEGAFVAVKPLQHARYIYADRADYEFSITLPNRYALAGPGTVASESADGATAWRVEADGQREFALSLGMRWREYAGASVLGTPVRVLSGNRAAGPAVLEAAIAALDFCEGHFGPLGSPLTFAQSDYALGGLVSQGLVLISDAADKMEIRRDIAEQFFGFAAYAMPTEDAWMSDALSEYLAYLLLKDAEGEEAFLAALNRNLVPAVQYTLPGGLEVTNDASLFNADEYNTVVVRRGALVFHELDSAMGTEDMLAGFKLFLARGRAGDVLGEYDLIASLDEASGRSWEAFLTDWLFNIDQYQQQYIDWMD